MSKLACLLSLVCVLAAGLYGGTLSPQLDSIIRITPLDKPIPVMVKTALQADLRTLAIDSTLPRQVIYRQKVEYLKQVAEQAQAGLLAFLRRQPQVESLEALWLTSLVAFKAPARVIRAVAARGDVQCVNDRFYDMRMCCPTPGSGGPEDDLDWNITRVQADKCWEQGITGEGVVVCNIGSGVKAQHPALVDHWRSEEGWYDAFGIWPAPNDEINNGTFATGLVCGGDGPGPGGPDIGVAPGAKFIAARAFRGIADYDPLYHHRCFNWVAGLDHPPDVVFGAWGTPNRDDDEFWDDIRMLWHLGITYVGPTGDVPPGGAPGTSWSPGSFPIVIDAGSTMEQDDEVSPWSGRGPAPDEVPWTASEFWPRPDWSRVNPTVCAPGLHVRSCDLENGYIVDPGLSGWGSSAVAGCVALLLQKQPNLGPEGAFNIIADGAEPKGVHPNNDYGWGILNCLNSLNALPQINVIGTSTVQNPFGAAGNNIVCQPGTQTLQVAYESENSIYYTTSTDGGVTWNTPDFVEYGTEPCISLDYSGNPWIAYVHDDGPGYSLNCSFLATDGHSEWWVERLVYRVSDPDELHGPSLVCSNWAGDGAVQYPPPAMSDMGYLVAMVKRAGDPRDHRILFIPFDTTYVNPSNNMYNYGVMTLIPWHNVSDMRSASISRTPGDYIHVTWNGYFSDVGDWRVFYQTAFTNPALIRNGTSIQFTRDTRVGVAEANEVHPANDPYGERVSAVWETDDDFGTIWAAYRYVYQNPVTWCPEGALNEVGQHLAKLPTASRGARLWSEWDWHNGATDGRGHVAARLQGEDHSWRVTPDMTVDQWFAQAVYRSSAPGGADTLSVIWSTCYPPFPPYDIYYTHCVHGNYRENFYSVTCGLPEQSPYCPHRDGYQGQGALRWDYDATALTYNLRYLDPRYRYAVNIRVYHESSAPITENFAFPGFPPGLGFVVPPRQSTWTTLEIPPEVYRDGVADLVVTKLEGEYAAISDIEVCEYKPAGSGGTEGVQTAGGATLLTSAILGVTPNPFSGRATIRYQVPGTGPASLRILDVTGRCVRVAKPAETVSGRSGVRTFCWDGRSDAGRAMPAGVYFCQLEASGARSTAKLCLTR